MARLHCSLLMNWLVFMNGSFRMNRSLLMGIWVALGVAGFGASAFAQERFSWSSLDGKYQIEAEFVRLENDQVILLRSDFQRVSVPISQLSLASQLQARRLADPERAKEAAEVDAKRTGGAASNSNASSGSGQAARSTRSSLKEGATAQETAEYVLQEIQNENFIAVWDILPAKHQHEIKELVELASEKVGPVIVPPIRDTAKEIIDLLKNKKSMVLATRHLKTLPIAAADIEKSYDPGVEAVDALFKIVDILDSTNVKGQDFRTVLQKFVSNFVAKSNAFKATLPKDFVQQQEHAAKDVKLAVRQIDKDNAEVSVTPPAPGEPFQLQLTLVDGRWLPNDFAKNWDKNYTQIKDHLSKMTAADLNQIRQQTTMMTSLVNGTLGSIKNAKTQAEFDDAIEGVAMATAMFGGQMGQPNLDAKSPVGSKELDDIFGK